MAMKPSSSTRPRVGLGPGGEGKFWTASANGSRVFFTEDLNPLTPDAGFVGELYMYDFDGPSGDKLTPISADGDAPFGAEVEGVIGASEAGDYVYFVAKAALDAGAIGGQPNLYVWHEGESPRFIATLSAADTSDWSASPDQQTARVTPDGHHLAFLSRNSLTGFDNVDQGSGEPDAEAFLYDYGNDKVICASCNPSGAQPIGPAALPIWKTPYQQPRYLSDDGSRLFFESGDSLALNDTNGERDVYQYEAEGIGDCTAASPSFISAAGGCVSLISTGKSSDESYFLDASTSGDDVFISTRQRLVPQDEDERYDAYDARVGGGFPTPAAPAACSGEACRPAQAIPGEAMPGSSSFARAGQRHPAA